MKIITPEVNEKRITFRFIGTYGSCFLVTGFNLKRYEIRHLKGEYTVRYKHLHQ